MPFYDWTYLLILPGLILGIWAQSKVKRAYKIYSKIETKNNMNGVSAANKMLNSNGIFDISIEPGRGELTDHYDPAHKKIVLSEKVYNTSSIAAVAIAAHECGHVLQHASGYSLIKLRTAIVPVANFGSFMTYILIILGLVFSYPPLINIGIILFCAVVLFQIITYPVEINASKRALAAIQNLNMLENDEISMAKKVLDAAALTYFAALVSSLLALLRLILLSRRR